MTQIRTFNLLEYDALEVDVTPFGRVGRLHSGEGIEAVWVSKQDEAVDPDWFSQPMVDLIVVLQGGLKVEFEALNQADRVLNPGELLVLPAGTRCRAYRWPRDQEGATVFLAVYPKK